MRARPRYSCATGTVPLTTHTASSAITSNSARASPPRNAANTRSMLWSPSAFKRRERQSVAGELRVVELRELAMPRPDDRLAARVDLVRERHAAVVVDARNRLRERERDAFEGVVVVVQHDHAPRSAEPAPVGATDARACARRGEGLRH